MVQKVDIIFSNLYLFFRNIFIDCKTARLKLLLKIHSMLGITVVLGNNVLEYIKIKILATKFISDGIS